MAFLRRLLVDCWRGSIWTAMIRNLDLWRQGLRFVWLKKEEEICAWGGPPFDGGARAMSLLVL